MSNDISTIVHQATTKKNAARTYISICSAIYRRYMQSVDKIK